MVLSIFDSEKISQEINGTEWERRREKLNDKHKNQRKLNVFTL